MGAKVAAKNAMADLAAGQHGVVTTGQLRELGVSRRAIAAKADAGTLHRLHHGVYAVGHLGLSQESHWLAAVLACLGYSGRAPGEAFLSHRSAATLWGLLPPIRGPIDVAIIGEAGRARRRGIRVHRPRTLEESMTACQNGIPVTSPARTLVDLRRAKPSRGGATPGQLRHAHRQATFLGLPLGPATPDHTRSELEQVFLDLCGRHRLPTPHVNVEIGGLTVDFLWPRPGLVVETDGYRFHRGRAAFEDDKRRDLHLRGLGIDVVRLTYDQVANEPKIVIATLRRLLAAT
jgi:very-short-patch-repair endonuclease